MYSRIANIKIPLISHIKDHPFIQIEDIYKFAYQACFGIAHIFPSKDKFIENIDDELSQISIDSSISKSKFRRQLFEYLKEDRTIARVDIYLYSKKKYPLEDLYSACQDACFEIKKEDKELFIILWEDILSSLKNKDKYFSSLSISNQSIKNFNEYIMKNDYPMISHSEIYKSIYKPCYRLVNPANLLKSLSSHTD